ncbi:MAG: DUF1553 domain-containing protein [Pirellulaceae bacterium]|nr:DUF1553 domain-containing protein [Pirellulaceae bacterium]MDP7016196.1 DUF1553 domain-containing protein [Pirellulaceae bacterium]
MARSRSIRCAIALSVATTSILVLGSKLRAEEDLPAAQVEYFEAKIRPVLVKHCYECHSSQSKPLKGGLSLETREATRRGGDSGPAVTPKEIDDSLLISAIRYDDFEMPPKGKLPAAVIGDFERWVEMGAVDPRDGSVAVRKTSIDYQAGLKFWSFRPVVAPPRPGVKDVSWPRNGVDYFVLARLEAAGLTPSVAADRRGLIRRAYFSVIGLPPTPAEVRSFLDDSSEQAFTAVVDRLLDSPHYGERWGRHWLDVARYGEDQAHTFKARRYPLGYRYRDWVVQALNDDMPYDRFLTYQIAADLTDDSDKHEHLPALGLFAMGPVYYQDNGEKAKALADEWDDRIDTLMRGVLGLTAACARCHDHKYDPISMTDYYALAGVFAASQYQERPIVGADVLARKQRAAQDQKNSELAVNRYLAEQAKQLRPQLADRIPDLAVAAWKYQQRTAGEKDKKKRGKIQAEIAMSDGVSATLITRWANHLFAKPSARKPQPHLAPWREWLGKFETAYKDPQQRREAALTDATTAQVRAWAASLRDQLAELEPRRSALFAQYGANAAFVGKADRATVSAGWIPLGNLFDDGKQTSLEAALVSDKNFATAGSDDLGVQRVVQGWGESAEIAPGVHFNFAKLGSDGSQHGSVVNDGWGSGSLSTKGRTNRSGKRDEQGVGMHANALITFDLDEIRRAGLLPQDQRFVFRVDRAGLNDDVFGSASPSAHMAVLFSKPHSKENVFDAVISGFVNGAPLTVEENDKVYYFGGQVPPPLKADGKFVKFDVKAPADAKFVTLVATGAGGPDDNPINSDHTVFSGARLELDPLPTAKDAKLAGDGPASSNEQDQQAAVLLSTFFYDEGLLGAPAKEAEPFLAAEAKQQLAALRKLLADKKKAHDDIDIPKAHALIEGKSSDLSVYLQGDPTKQGDVAPRSLPAIFTHGERTAFKTDGSGRRDLAAGIASVENPLTSRVIVNRIWQGHFGHGLVRTPSNFGSLGERPTHPQLLDYLAKLLIDSDWSLKAVHREILLSATFEQASTHREDLAERDPDNRLLWRMNRRRLEVEPWRDAMLAVSGTLDREFGGPSQNLEDVNNRRRTVYGFVSRHRLNELLRLFDFPDPNITSDQRSVTTVPLQQLFVLNSKFMENQARALVERLKETADDEERIERAFGLLYARSPSSAEVTIGLDFLTVSAESKQEGDRLTPWEQYALVLLGSNEFAFVD